MLESSKIYLIFVLCLVNFGQTAKILGLFPMQSGSHHFIGNSLMKALAQNGHEVTYISPFPEKETIKGYKQIVLTGFMEEMQRNHKNLFEDVSSSLVIQTLFIHNWGKNLARKIFEHPNIQKLLASNETFDVVIVPQFFLDSLKGFAWHYKAHLIIFSIMGTNTWTNELMGNPSPPSYIPEIISELTPEMNFLGRIQTSFSRLFVQIVLNFLAYPAHNKILHDYFPNAPHINDILYNTSLGLLNSDISFNQAIPKVPNMVEVGGLHIRPAKKLPENLQTFLDNATEGVIYFSMGSNLKSAQMPTATKELLLKVFSRLKQKVLWKFEESLPGKPHNVEIRKWFPQQDVLGHPNVKLFITHGGLLSTTESVYNGLPILAIPVFADQRYNAIRAAQKGLGLYIYYHNLSEAYFENCLNELLTNERYSNRAKQLSEIFHDKPMKPMDTAVYWVEYIIRHRGAPFLRVSALNLNIFQYLLLDVIAFSIITIFLTVIILTYFCSNIFRKSMQTGKSKKQQ